MRFFYSYSPKLSQKLSLTFLSSVLATFCVSVSLKLNDIQDIEQMFIGIEKAKKILKV